MYFVLIDLRFEYQSRICGTSRRRG